jgi:integrase
MQIKSNLPMMATATLKRAVRPLRRRNIALRSREHLTETEVKKLIEAAKSNRHGHRDATMVLVAYRHGLRASEVCDLQWEQVEFNSATLHVRRVKNGKPSTHPIRGDELRALRRLERDAQKSRFIFVSERGAPFTVDGFNWIIKRAGKKAGFLSKPMPICFGTLADTNSRPTDTTRDQFRIIWVTEIFSTQFATRSYRPNDLEVSGRSNWPTESETQC